MVTPSVRAKLYSDTSMLFVKEKEVEELKAEIDALSSQCDELVQENNELNEEVDRLTLECEGLVEDNELLSEDIHNNATAAKRLDLIRDIL